MKKMIALLMILTLGSLVFASPPEVNNLAPPIGVELSVDNSFQEQSTPVEYIFIVYEADSVMVTVPGYSFDQNLYAVKPGSSNNFDTQEREAIGLIPYLQDFI